ncbi:glycosyltransferase [Shouchella clausii]|uniref:glycosyltransferase n=1 Tax=Shouchella clausii TaxID=79880 RepID=UPI0011552253|nr:glycosyltransferase [Shouchella clausii]MBX0319605.1 glycosyltransferase [Shouchella clausii]MDO7283910.1 glycosyltransferase [Shouchella clausii]MDO7304006.1 glycosyltransferase [Shouchella clausii]
MKSKILFVLPSLSGGGAEKVMLTIMKHLPRDKFDLHLAIVSNKGQLKNLVPKDIVIHDLRLERVRSIAIPFIKLVWAVKPNKILSTLGHLNLTILMLRKFFPPNTEIIVREANTVSEIIKRKKRKRLWTMLYKKLYKKANAIICQSDFMKEDLKHNFSIDEERLHRIYNPVDIDKVRELAYEEESPFKCNNQSNIQEKNIIAIGRLSHQKGFDRILKPLQNYIQKGGKCKLWVLGEGQLEEELNRQVDELNLSSNVKFVGFQTNPYVWLKHADLFVLSSNYEGLPNVLLEAISLKCPVISVEHPGGTYEIMMKTNLLDRYIPEIEFIDSFFEPLSVDAPVLLSKYFGVSKAVSEYQRILAT